MVILICLASFIGIIIISGLLADPFSIKVTQGGGAKTDSALAEFLIECSKPCKVAIGTAQPAEIAAEGKRQFQSFLQFGKNQLQVKISIEGKDFIKDFSFYRMTPLEAAQQAEITLLEECKSQPERHVKIINSSWQIGGFGVVAKHTVLVSNECPMAVKDIVFGITYSAPSGTRIQSNSKQVFESIPGRSQKYLSFDGLVNSQASAASVRIESVR